MTRKGEPLVVIDNTRCMRSGSFEVLPFCVRADDIPTRLGSVPPACYSSSTAKVGGLGEHFRWRVPAATVKGHVEFMVSARSEEYLKFHLAMRSLRTKLGISPEFEVASDGDYVAVAMRVQSRHYAFACATLLSSGFDVDVDHTVSLLCEKLDRAESMWVQQFRDDASRAAPLRKGMHWNVSFQPGERPVFTWQGLAERVCADVCNSEAAIRRYPDPLRSYMRAHHDAAAQRASRDDAPMLRIADVSRRLRACECHDGFDTAARQLLSTAAAVRETAARRETDTEANDKEPSCHVFMSKLSKAQETQLLSSYWFFSIGPSGADRDAHRTILLAYFIHGYLVRAVAPYRPSGLNVGRSCKIRAIARPEYGTLCDAVANRVVQPNGELRGTGFRGATGKRAVDGVPVYKPSRRNAALPASTFMRRDNAPCG